MNGVNKVILVGTVGKDPEYKATGDSGVVNFSMATSENYKDKDGKKQTKTEWHNIVAWGKLSEIIEKYIKKGSRIYVEGKSTTRSWEGEDGKKNYRHEIKIYSMQMLGEKKPQLDPEEPRNQEPVVDSDLPF